MRSCTVNLPRPLASLTLAVVVLSAFVHRDVQGAETVAAKEVRTVLEVSPRVEYRIYAVRVGRALHARRGLFIADPSMKRHIEVAFSFWVLKSEARTILVDTGFVNQGMIDRWNIKDYRDPVEGLAAIDVDATQITDIIVTHGHWDHIGGIGRFRKARIWIHEAELKAVRSRNRGRLPKAFLRAKQEDRLHVTTGVERIAPSVVAVPAGQHTPGCQYVVVQKGDDVWVLATDVAPLYANFERHRPTGQVQAPAKVLAIQDVMKHLAGGEMKRIVPGHEPSLYTEKDIVELARENEP